METLLEIAGAGTTLLLDLARWVTTGSASLLPGLADLALGGMLVMAAASVATLLLRERSAALRHMVWALAAAALLVLPALEVALPAWPVAFPGLEASSRFEQEPRAPAPAPEVVSSGTIDAAPAVGHGVTAGAFAGVAPTPPVATTAAPAAAPVAPIVAAGPSSASAAPPPQAGPPSADRMPIAPLLLLAGWFLGAAALLGHLAVGLVRAGALAGAGRLADEPRIHRLVDDARAALGIGRPIHVVWSRRVAVPLTFGSRQPVLVLPAEARAWSDERLRHVVLHELAHVDRNDYAWGLAAEVARAIHWPNPLAWLAVHRMRVEREMACDDRVLRAGCRASDYAEDLLGVAASLGPGWRAGAAVVPMARPQELGGRVEAILDPDVRRERVRPAAVALALLAALGVALPAAAVTPAGERSEPAEPTPVTAGAAAAPTPSGEPPATALPAVLPDPRPAPAAPTTPQVAGQELCVFRESGRRSTSISSDEDRTTIEWSTDDCRVDIDIRGDVGFAADDSGITRVPPGGRFEIEERLDGDSRRVLAESGSGGAPSFSYWRDGDRQPFDPEGRRWLAAILPELFRHTTINAEARVRRILEREGVDGVIAEVERMVSDHVTATYLEHLLAMVEPDEATVRRVLGVVERRVDSDHYRAEILGGLARRGGLAAGVHDAYMDAAAGIDSDHYTTQVLTLLMDQPDVPQSTRARILDVAAGSVDSDHYLSEILIRLVREGELDRVGREAFLRTLRSVESDHYTSQVVSAFLELGGLSSDELVDVIGLLGEIESDHYRSELLRRVAAEESLGGAVLDAWAGSLRGIESDHYLSRTLVDLVTRDEAGPRHVEAALDVLRSVESDHYRVEVLTVIAGRHRLEGALRDRYLDVAEGIGSRHYRDRALAAVARGGGA